MGLKTVKKEHEWYNVNLSTPESVQGLLRYRSQFDLLFGRGLSHSSLETSEIDLTKQIEEVTCLYIWIDNILKKMKLTEQQKKVVQSFMEGYTTEEIAEEDGSTPQNINKMLLRVCNRISEMAHRDWLKTVSIKKLGVETKKCKGKCGEELPITKEFFSPKAGSKDGFRHICKLCR